MALVNVTIDGREIKAQAGQTILEAALAAGIDIPTLCHHPALEPIGACRLCLVEVERQRNLQPACTFKVTDGMVVHTESEKVVKTRRFLLELLFSERNHYCMYCQMSGDCELQSLAYRYGLDSWLYPRPYTPMPVDATREYFVMDHNRCILCRRCVRACQELVGNYTLGLRGRGLNTMVVADTDVPFGESSCLSCGTCLQVCPTGALMDRHSAYRGVAEEVERTRSTCLECSVGCGVELIVRDNHLLRVEGDWDADVNRGLLCADGRFESLRDGQARIRSPMVRRDGELQEVSWDEALEAIAAGVKELGDDSLVALVSSRATNEALSAFAQTFKTAVSLVPIPSCLKEAEGSLAELDEADLFLVVGTDLDVSHKVVGMAVRRGLMNRGARLVIVGEGGPADMAHYKFTADEVEKAVALARGASSPAVVYGAGAGELLDTLRESLGDKATFLGLVPGSNARGLLAAGIAGEAEVNGAKGAFVFAADETVDGDLLERLSNVEFLVVQASYENPLLERADVVLPATVWAEKSGTITNTEGRTQKINAVLQPPAGVRDDLEVLEALATRLS